jgi:hypothetical protein
VCGKINNDDNKNNNNNKTNKVFSEYGSISLEKGNKQGVKFMKAWVRITVFLLPALSRRALEI